MTIVELMIVLTIIASIMGLVGYSVMGVSVKADVKTATLQIRKLSEAVATQQLSNGNRQLPDSLDELAAGSSPLLDSIPNDPWGKPYIYERRDSAFVIYSAGPDGVEGTEDDVTGDLDQD